MSVRSSVGTLLGVALAAWIALGGCGDDGASGPGVDPNKNLNMLTAAERRSLCDWAAGLFGGYGKVRKCSAQVGWPGPASAEACVGDLSRAGASCTVTVATYEACQRAFVADEICRENAFPAPCQMVFTCLAAQ